MPVSPWACSLTPEEAYEAIKRRRKREETELIIEGFRQRRNPLPMPEGLNISKPVDFRERIGQPKIGNPSVVITNQPPGLRPAMIRRPDPPKRVRATPRWRLKEPVRKPNESDKAFNTRLTRYERLLKAVTS